MLVSFTRDPSKFKLANYVQYVTTKDPVFLYLRLEVEQMARLVTNADLRWEDGQDRPMGFENQHKFDFVPVRTIRYTETSSLGHLAVKHADWNIVSSYTGMLLQQLMTNRTDLVATLLTTTSNWASIADAGPSSNHYADANTLNSGAGLWTNASDDPASPNYNAIKKSLMEAIRQIIRDTNAVVQWNDLVLIVGPDLALKMAATPEVTDYVKNTPYALAQLRGDEAGQNAVYGLPDQLYGLKLMVEDTVKNTSRAGATTQTRAFIWPTNQAAIVSRKGGLEGNYGGPSFSTVQLYFLEEMTVETMDDVNNRRTTIAATDNFKEVLAAPAAGYLIQNCT